MTEKIKDNKWETRMVSSLNYKEDEFEKIVKIINIYNDIQKIGRLLPFNTIVTEDEEMKNCIKKIQINLSKIENYLKNKLIHKEETEK